MLRMAAIKKELPTSDVCCKNYNYHVFEALHLAMIGTPGCTQMGEAIVTNNFWKGLIW